MPAGNSDQQVKNVFIHRLAKGTIDMDHAKAWMAENDDDDDEDWEKAVEAAKKKARDSFNSNPERNKMEGSISTNDVLGAGVKGHLRVKAPGERYSKAKSTALHIKSGKPVSGWDGNPVQTQSEWEKAAMGAWAKSQFVKAHPGAGITLNEHDKQMIEEIFATQDFCGELQKDHWVTDIPGKQVKALLNDSTSGGQNLVPIYYDRAIVEAPLLYGELTPHVDLRDVPQGSSIVTEAVGNPTVTWGNAAADGANLTPFDTSGFVTRATTTVFPVACAVLVGLDFMSDSLASIGDVLYSTIGQRLKSELDKCIAIGNGTSQPLGIFNDSGVTLVQATNPTNGPWTVNDPMNLMFGVPKQYRAVREWNSVFLSNDTTYMRLRSLATGVTGDARLLFGMDVQSYNMLDVPYKISNDLSNGYMAFGMLKKYRLFRRMGVFSKWETSGQTLTLSNQGIFYVRARFGGRPIDPAAFAILLDGKS